MRFERAVLLVLVLNQLSFSAVQAKSPAEAESFAHTSQSYEQWQQGNIVRAVQEGQAALEIAPDDFGALINLALIKEGLDDDAAAIPLYQRASAVNDKSCVPLLGLARCLIKRGKPSEGVAVLEQMSSRAGMDFEWYYESGDTLLRVDRPELAVNPIEKAVQLASTTEQKALSQSDALLAYLRTNQKQKAELIWRSVIESTQKDVQVYGLIAQKLVEPSEPARAEVILSSALKNLGQLDDADGFYRLGRIFQEKYGHCKKASKTAEAWLSLIAQAYNRAIALVPQSRFYLGLAFVMSEQGNSQELASCLRKSMELDVSETLPTYLLKQGAAPVDLQKVEFSIENLNCGCHVSKVGAALIKSDGVAFVHIDARDKPYKGMMLLEQGRTAEQAFSQADEKIKVDYANMKTSIVADWKKGSLEPIKTAASAIASTQQAQYGDAVHFVSIFKPVVPLEPKQALATRQ